ncbi:MAG: circularly permuted type 2 ATP-grasp protein [Pseudomonadota bacterium]
MQVYNEMYRNQEVRAEYHAIKEWLDRHGPEALLERSSEAEEMFRRIGITFAVYVEGGDPDRLIPFDMIPRVFNAQEWNIVESGSIQRAKALNAFISDVYGAGEILKAGIVPEGLIKNNPAYLKQMEGYAPPRDIWSHIIGVDIVRTGEEEFFVLEDNCRTPSGVSYVLQNREVMSRMFPQLFMGGRVRAVDGYGDHLAAAMNAVAPANCRGKPVLALLTPGQFNSAYYEHFYLADLMGIDLVEGADLFVENDVVYMRTTGGPERVDVLYRRIDDDFIDPQVFNPDSMLGVPGIIGAMKAGNVTLVNAPGAGVVDDKAVYTYVPDMIRFYLGEEPVIKNVPTYRCDTADQYAYVLDNLAELVVKEVHGSGGYGMLVGPTSTKEEIESFRKKLEASPANYIAQPTLSLSTSPVLTAQGLAPRHVDLRPFVLSGEGTVMIPSGLTRVALQEGSLVVNSSQGGGVKDTWVLNEGWL